MRKTVLLIIALAASFGLGYAFQSATTKTEAKKKKVTGIGGIFFKCKDPKAAREWYKQHLGFDMSDYGANFQWREADDSTRKGSTQWTVFGEKTKYFAPSTKDFMINYRVDDLTGLVADLKKEGVTIVDTLVAYDYGKFIHIMDEEGNKIELWEPVNSK